MFERRKDVGGLWNYDAQPGACDVHMPREGEAHLAGYASWPERPLPASAMYEGLFTNIPSDIMAYRDFAFPQGTALFPQRQTVLDYVRAFARENRLLDRVRLNTEVEHVVRTEHDPHTGRSKWRVVSRSTDAPRSAPPTVEEYDFLCAAHGRCNVPHIPQTTGIEYFRGRQTHSAWYRYPQEFRGQRVLIVGSNSSGGDVARELCGGSKRDFPGSREWAQEAAAQPPRSGVVVFQAYRHPDEPPQVDYYPRDPSSPDWCHRIQVVSTIDRILEDGTILLVDGSTLRDIDTIIWATGFLYDAPFLDHTAPPFDEHPVVPREAPARVTVAPSITGATTLVNLDDWFLFYRYDVSLCFLGLLNRIVPFPFMETQARVVACVWLGLIPPLPPLRGELSPMDPERWVPQPRDAQGEPVVHSNLSLAADCEDAYLDALIAQLPGDMGKRRPPWEQEHPADPALRGEGFHGKESWFQTPTWRRVRRRNGKALRRELLGY